MTRSLSDLNEMKVHVNLCINKSECSSRYDLKS